MSDPLPDPTRASRAHYCPHAGLDCKRLVELHAAVDRVQVEYLELVERVRQLEADNEALEKLVGSLWKAGEAQDAHITEIERKLGRRMHLRAIGGQR
jgi:hypothetical protein